MKVILTENQYRQLLKEAFDERITNSLSKVSEFGVKVINDAFRQLKFDFRFLTTYGAGIGAILQSVFDYLNNTFTGLDDTQIAGLTVMAIGVVFFENKDLREHLSKIKEMNLESELVDAINFTESLKNKFSHLLRLLGLTIHRTSNIISYSFLIPILSIVIEVVTKHGVDSTQFEMLVESLLTSGLIAAGGVALRDVLIKAGDLIQNKGIK